MNKLDTQEEFQIELMNPNPSSSKTKEGPIYRVSFEMHQDDWQCFMDANTKGMILVGTLQVLESNPVEPEKPKGGVRSKDAAFLCQDEDANRWASSLGFRDLKDMIYTRCAIKSRAELDHNPEALEEYERIKVDFLRSMGYA